MRTIASGLLAGLVMLSLPVAAAAETLKSPRRASGLWEVSHPAMPLLGWKMCVDSARDDLVNDNLWPGFQKDCRLLSQGTQGHTYSLKASCGDAIAFDASFEGDYVTRYTATGSTAYELNGKPMRDRMVFHGKWLGACPADLPPGRRRYNNGVVDDNLYQGR